MSIKTDAKAMIHTILTNPNEWSESMTFEDEGGNIGIAVGMYIEHSTSMDSDGMKVIGLEGRVTITEEALDDAGLSVRNTEGEMNLKNWKVTVAHQNGTSVKYRIEYFQPDESLGMIVCYLAEYAAN